MVWSRFFLWDYLHLANRLQKVDDFFLSLSFPLTLSLISGSVKGSLILKLWIYQLFRKFILIFWLWLPLLKRCVFSLDCTAPGRKTFFLSSICPINGRIRRSIELISLKRQHGWLQEISFIAPFVYNNAKRSFGGSSSRSNVSWAFQHLGLIFQGGYLVLVLSNYIWKLAFYISHECLHFRS